MKTAVALLVAVLFGSAVLSAQTASPSQPQTEMHKTVTSTPPDGADRSVVWTTRPATDADTRKAQLLMAPFVNTCPVSLSAQQSSSAYRREVGSGSGRVEGPAQWVRLNIVSPDSRRVVAATVTVHGFADKSRMIPASSAVLSSRDPSDASWTVGVRFPPGEGRQVAKLIRVPGLTGVTTVDLKAVTYEDGSTWSLAAGGSCSVSVGGLMLVGER